jgi:flavin reductase (DIM6/NTAB) family NADH-FMN oxidoreductase RutF/DNA-binding MarR family transcriptional regulator
MIFGFRPYYMKIHVNRLMSPPRQAQPPSFSPHEFRIALGMFATGVTIVTARTADGKVIGLTANSFNSVSLDPPLVLWSLSQDAASLAAFRAGSHYAINVLAADQKTLAEKFALKGTDRFAGVSFVEGTGGAPLLAGAAATFECFNRSRYEEGDHVIFVGEVERCSWRADASPLLFHGGQFYAEHPIDSGPRLASGKPRFVDNYLGYLLGQANYALYKEFDAHVHAAGLSSIEWRVLATLHDSEPLTIGQLAREVLSKQPTVTKLVQRMAEQGWVALQADANDQRCTCVVATAAGKRLVGPLVDEAKEHDARMLRALGAIERVALRRLLEKLTQHA